MVICNYIDINKFVPIIGTNNHLFVPIVGTNNHLFLPIVGTNQRLRVVPLSVQIFGSIINLFVLNLRCEIR